LIDIDNFKGLNDTYGHLAGDEVLQYTAGILQDAVAQTGVVARLGGDEYVLFIQHSPSEQQVDKLVEQLQSTLSRYIAERYRDLTVNVTLSIGISQFPKDANEGQALIDHADQTMYEIKRRRKMKPINI